MWIIALHNLSIVKTALFFRFFKHAIAYKPIAKEKIPHWYFHVDIIEPTNYYKWNIISMDELLTVKNKSLLFIFVKELQKSKSILMFCTKYIISKLGSFLPEFSLKKVMPFVIMFEVLLHGERSIECPQIAVTVLSCSQEPSLLPIVSVLLSASLMLHLWTKHNIFDVMKSF